MNEYIDIIVISSLFGLIFVQQMEIRDLKRYCQKLCENDTILLKICKEIAKKGIES